MSKRPRPKTSAAEAAPKQRAKPAAQATSAVNNSAAEAGGGRPAEAALSAAGKVIVKKRKARPAVADASTAAPDRRAAEAGASTAAAGKKKRAVGSGAAAGASDVPGLAAAPDDAKAGAGTAPLVPHKREAPAKAAGKARGAPHGSAAAAGASEEAEASRAARKAQRARKAAGRKAGALGGVPSDPERRAAWLARVAELAAARAPTDKPLPRPMRLALKQKLREDKRAAMAQHAEARASRVLVSDSGGCLAARAPGFWSWRHSRSACRVPVWCIACMATPVRPMH